MAIDYDQLIEVVKRTLGAGNASPDVWAQSEIDLAALKNIATERLAGRVAMDRDRRGLLQQDYSVTLDANGVGDPLTAIGSVTGGTDIIWGSIPLGNVQDADNNSLVLIPHLPDFYRPASIALAYYCLVDRKIRTRALSVAVNNAADIVTVNGPITVTANFETSDLTFWPGELFNDLAQEIVSIALTKMMPAPVEANA